MPADATPSSSGSGNTVTLKTTGREGTVSLQYPLLTKSNYSAWAINMKVYMRAQGVWDAIEPTDLNDEVETRKDQMALAAIYQAISEETLLVLAEKETAKEAWEMLKTMHMGAERVKEAKIQTLRNEFEGLRMHEVETVDDFGAKLTTIVNKIRALGDKIDEAYVVKKLLRAVPPKFLQIASTIEQFGNLNTMAVEEVIGSLKTHDERLRGYGDNEEEHVLLTSAKWKGKQVKGEGESSSNSYKGRGTSSGRGHGRGCGRGRGRGHSEGGRWNESNHRERKFDKSKKKDERAYLAEVQGDDEEPALLATEICEIENHAQLATEGVMLYEEKVKPKLDGEEEVVHENTVWFLDTGASNHMTGCKKWFSELDETITGKVKFGDGSVVDIQGKGTVMFQCQNGEHRLFTSVYFIPRLRSNIVSLDQLDENGCMTVIEDGCLMVYDRSRRLLAKVRRSRNRLYVLNLKKLIQCV
ncbi:uncharacterized protein LOC109826605 [Asparagus officinalis]|uniref:uncharacterized protein LOC109826605 n=1 Tax=Asparagus officinalis TaxID=4686 RepID=UPI00098E7979|nr:uncharacterized protein LOC109826605 [Asparagus officinalis]